MRIGVVGLGRLGLPMAALYASHGFDVLGIDQSEWLVGEVKQGRCPIQETGLEELLTTCGERLQVTTDYGTLGESSIVFIIVPTPSDKSGAFSNEYVLSAIRSIGQAVKGLNQIPLVVVTSTVMPGTMETIVKPELEKILGKEAHLCYNPEFIALGSVIANMEHPDSLLIGESDEKSGNLLSQFYYIFHNGSPPPICRMSLWNAEVAKISLNISLTAKISLANTIASVCERIPNGNVEDVVRFIGLDSRIGHKFLQSGLGAGGTCLPRDQRAFISFAKQYGVECPMQKAIDVVNMSQVVRVADRIVQLVERGKTVSVFGLTYKPNTPVVEESPAIRLSQELSEQYQVKVYDPQGMENAEKLLGNWVEYSQDINSCLHQSDLCVIATPWDAFKTLTHKEFKVMRRAIVFDCWRILDRQNLESHGIEYHAVGISDA